MHTEIKLLFHLCILNVTINSYGHADTSPPFYWTVTQHKDTMTSEMRLKNNHPSKQQLAVIRWPVRC